MPDTQLVKKGAFGMPHVKDYLSHNKREMKARSERLT